jgi:F0F1-type ATP synthase assembly protein I
MSHEAPPRSWMGRGEQALWGMAIVLVSIVNLWGYRSGDAGVLALAGSIVLLVLFVLFVARAVYFLRRNRARR